MTLHTGLIDQLERAISNGDIKRRAKALGLVADLFVLGSGRFLNDHIDLFDEIMQCIVGKVEKSVRAEFSNLLSSLSDAPSGAVRRLACDESIEVARPLLSRSNRLNMTDLVLIAGTMSQLHLLAISERPVVPEEVTDALLARGNQAVTRSAARNAGANFSDDGHLKLVERSRDDIDLAVSVWARADLPRMCLVKLFVEASISVQATFETQDPRKASLVRELVARASTELLNGTRSGSSVHVDAESHVMSLYRAGKLNDETLAEFAELHDFDRTAIGMSLLCDLPLELVEQVLVRDNNSEQLIVLTKASGLTWRTTKAILGLSAFPDIVETNDYERFFITFSRLQFKTATAAMQFYRLRERAKRSASET